VSRVQRWRRRQQMSAHPRLSSARCILASRSQRMRSRRKLCNQANVRSTTHRTRPSPEPCSVVRRAITGFTPRRHSSRRYLSWFVAAVGDYLVRALARPAAFARDGADPIDEREQLRHVVAIPPVSSTPGGSP
jgi:hypothetical protein